MEAIEYPQRRLIFGVILVQTEQLRIERIISTGQATPPDQWYNQEQDEWAG